MALEVGSIVEGTVSGIAKFGAFVELPENKVGLVHISEVANEYVSDVNDFLKVKDKVKVKILTIDDKGKIALSIKQAEPVSEEKQDSHHKRPNYQSGKKENFNREEQGQRPQFNRPFAGNRGQGKREAPPASFEDKLSRFLKDSDERLLDLKRNVESKRGGRGARRSD